MPRLTAFEIPKEIVQNETDNRIIEESAKTDAWVARLLLVLKLVIALGTVVIAVIFALK